MSKFTLGTPIYYTHRAAVARLKTKHEGFGNEHTTNNYWSLFEGAKKNTIRMEDFLHETDLFADWKSEIFAQPVYRGKAYGQAQAINKTIMVWPEDGSGVITGLVRRGIGKSVGGRNSGGLFGDDYDPGYFQAVAFFELYVVRHELRGQDYILVPLFAASPVLHG